MEQLVVQVGMQVVQEVVAVAQEEQGVEQEVITGDDWGVGDPPSAISIYVVDNIDCVTLILYLTILNMMNN